MPRYKKMMRVFLTNLGKYNEGELVGEWLDLPATDEEIKNTLDRIGINEEYEEYFITDWECDWYDMTEYSNLSTLNELAEKYDSLMEYEQEIFGALLEEGYDMEEALEKIDDCIFWSDCSDMEDVAREYCAECGILHDIPDNLQNYFDFAAFGRDMAFEGQFVFTASGCVEIL